jgi:DNA-binding CsgD family transcriptional regulator
MQANRQHSRLSKEVALRRIRRLASSGLPLYPFVQTLFELVAEAIPAGDLPQALWTDPESGLSWIFANLDQAKWVPVLANCGIGANPQAWRGLRPRNELDSRRPVLTLNEFTASDYRRSAIYEEFFRPLKLEQGLLLQLVSCGELTGYYPIYRSASMPSFSREEIVFLTNATPHIAHGLRIAKLNDASAMTVEESAPFARSPTGVVVMDSNGRPVALDQQARTLLFQTGLCDGLPVHACSEAQWRSMLEYIARCLRAIFQTRGQSSGQIAPPAAQILCSGAGIAFRLRGYAAMGESDLFIVLMEQVEPVEFFEQRMMYRYGLSRREAQVLGRIRNQVSIRTIARSLGVSMPTVKTYVRHIVEKLEAGSLSKLRETRFGQAE